MIIKKMKIGHRLHLGFGALIFLLLILAAATYVRIGNLADSIELTANDRYPKTVLAQSIKNEVNETARSMRNILLMTAPDDISNEQHTIGENSSSISASLGLLQKSISSEQGRKLLETIVVSRQKFSVLQREFLALVNDGKRDQSITLLLNTLRPAQLAYMNELDKLIAYQKGLMEASSRESKVQAQFTKWMVLGLAVSAIVVGVMVSAAITRSITLPIANAVDVATKVSRGDLTARIEVSSSDETGQLMGALKDMNDSLLSVVGRVRAGADSIATGATQMAAGNMDLSSRTEQQASALEETASSLEEMTSTVRENSGHARRANGLASSASQVALKGGEVVAQVVGTMGAIKDSSRKIVDIIAVIDGIAFQTNILALNAAVEAARAGEQGRGFAVVASEVRHLAQRSANAAKEIKLLIDDSVDKVEQGSQLVEQAGATMGEIVQSVQSVTAIMTEIAEASLQQEAGLEQINQAVAEMDSVTQQNAALVEEAAGASASLQEQVFMLRDVVGVFRLDAGNGNPTGARGAPVEIAPRQLRLG